MPPRLLVFLHGTTIMHTSAAGQPRTERVRQVTANEPSVRDVAGYVPVDGAVAKLRAWAERGAEIAYLSSHRSPENVDADRGVLRRWSFPVGPILFRSPGESYGDVAGRLRPDVLIEDDCESIGGVEQTVVAQLAPILRQRVTSIVVPEFGGIDHLPDDPERLTTWQG
jgi:hypothetical protein